MREKGGFNSLNEATNHCFSLSSVPKSVALVYQSFKSCYTTR
ncbi:hypothetical protein [Helicobacter pylori]|nr:hypothetical protein [Helicobacter pylori]